MLADTTPRSGAFIGTAFGYEPGAGAATQGKRDFAPGARFIKESSRLLREGDHEVMFRVIDTEKVSIPVHRSCALFGLSVSGYYAWKGRTLSRRQKDDMVLLAHIRSQFSTSHETYASPRMTVELQEDGIQVGRHRVARLMRDNGLKALQKRRYKKTTDSDHGGPQYADFGLTGHRFR
ncbi:hypothetical protein GGQ66_003949 [Rhizobium borbori]|uniref:HTH-like domain-containing protein n=1 Tax=Allorhizobium borbori TaxID=485907 RepID=A0A7W6K7D4_9HYPH|nr:hypothetical protein [Allorhizobium borbori]